MSRFLKQDFKVILVYNAIEINTWNSCRIPQFKAFQCISSSSSSSMSIFLPFFWSSIVLQWRLYLFCKPCCAWVPPLYSKTVDVQTLSIPVQGFPGSARKIIGETLHSEGFEVATLANQNPWHLQSLTTYNL